MTFNSAMNGIRPNDAARNAVKIPAWGGYIWKHLPDSYTEGHYQMRYVKRNGDQFVFDVDGSTSVSTYMGKIAHGTGAALGTGNPDPDTALPLDGQLNSAFPGADWIQGSNADFESSRTGTGEW